MNISIRESKHKGYESYIMESDDIKLELVPELGAKIVSIVYKQSGKEWLLDPGKRSLEKPDPASRFVDCDMSGWDECFPTIDYCVIDQEQPIALPDHGEVWSLAWHCEADNESITCTVDGVCLPYKLSRRITFLSANQIRMSYHVENKGTASLPFLWVPHPQFQVSEKTRILLPDSIKDMLCIYGGKKLSAGVKYDWTEHDLVLPEPVGDGRKFYAEGNVSEGWCGLQGEETGDFLLMSVCPDAVPYLGIWIDEGLVNDRSAIALEPSIGYYDSLSRALGNGTAHILKPAEAFEWSLDLFVGSGDGRASINKLL
ncbi:aldose epimerase family protein [Cohnella abietis]|uniref:DUF5107 domain-containing protein n=1 Tax=Cohnella abietis TaxID=2507935 RepID=A0A3T1D2J4_9BACL|nr:hypothetical protein [Cohnella abietis]BBI32304.1 hypothetical protein KCTCHS21_17030 [Cohnella abietis]